MWNMTPIPMDQSNPFTQHIHLDENGDYTIFIYQGVPHVWVLTPYESEEFPF